MLLRRLDVRGDSYTHCFLRFKGWRSPTMNPCSHFLAASIEHSCL